MAISTFRLASWPIGLTLLIGALTSGSLADERRGHAPEGWTAKSPRDEIRPDFAYLPEGGCFTRTQCLGRRQAWP